VCLGCTLIEEGYQLSLIYLVFQSFGFERP
jgi:hypothetical protein